MNIKEKKEKRENKRMEDFDWKRREIMSAKHSRRCVGITKYYIRCTHRAIMYYVHQKTYHTLFLCNIHEKVLLRNGEVSNVLMIDGSGQIDSVQNH
jgi:hypothetical protein